MPQPRAKLTLKLALHKKQVRTIALGDDVDIGIPIITALGDLFLRHMCKKK